MTPVTAELKLKLKNLPTTPGVYMFYNDQGKIIYIGHSSLNVLYAFRLGSARNSLYHLGFDVNRHNFAFVPHSPGRSHSIGPVSRADFENSHPRLNPVSDGGFVRGLNFASKWVVDDIGQELRHRKFVEEAHNSHDRMEDDHKNR